MNINVIRKEYTEKSTIGELYVGRAYSHRQMAGR